MSVATNQSFVYDGVTVPPDAMRTVITNVTISDGVTSIREKAVYGCEKLQSVGGSIGTVENVGNLAFAYCKSLKSISLPVATNVGGTAFYECTSLTSVSLPVATTVSDKAFYGCTSLKEVEINGAKVDVSKLQLIDPDSPCYSFESFISTNFPCF